MLFKKLFSKKRATASDDAKDPPEIAAAAPENKDRTEAKPDPAKKKDPPEIAAAAPENKDRTEAKPDPVKKKEPNRNLMLSQYAAFYVKNGDPAFRDTYLQKVKELGIPENEADALFQFECDVCRKFPKEALLDPNYTRRWMFGLHERRFQEYPKDQEDMAKELYFTIGELCKLIDEAEWHFWNSHEREISYGVWVEIVTWRMMGRGGEFAIEQYLPAIVEKYPITMDSLGCLVRHYGTFLSRYRW